MTSPAPVRVLIADAEPAIHRSVATMLPAFELCSAYDAPSAVTAVETALAHHAEVALAIVDVALPGSTGFDTLERIWKIAPDTQGVLSTTTALDHRDVAARLVDTDAVLIIRKPFLPVEIAQAAHILTRNWLRQRAIRAHTGELEATVRARTAQLDAANLRLAEQLAWRERIETQVRVSQRLEAIGQLAAGIAHEINNPLQYVGDHLEFVTSASADLLSVVGQLAACAAHHEPALAASARSMLDDIDVPYLTKELPGALAQIQSGVHRITAIVRAMKELAHPGTRDPKAADINRALESALEISATAYRNIAVLDKQLGALPPVICFVSELGQVFLNLIVNAAHAMEGRTPGRLSVTTAVDGDHVEISIGDTGCGIPAELQQHIFDPFFTTKSVGCGTGQGLAIARAIVVDHHRGSLSFDSIAERGTTFTIRIPIRGPAHQATAAA